MKLRPYQKDCIQRVKNKLWSGVNRQLVKLFTGAGKTCIFAAMPDELEFKQRAMVIIHREELAQQAASKLRNWNPNRSVGVEMGTNCATNEQLVVGSVQTLGRVGSKRLAQFTPQDFDALIIDECHHASADSYRRVLDHFDVFNNTARLLCGFTATPNRADGKGLNAVFQEIVEDKDILYGIKNGWLVDLKGFRVKTKVELDEVHTQAGDFQKSGLASTVNTEERNTAVVKGWLEHANDRQTVAFGVNVQHAKDLAQKFKEFGVSAEAIWADDPDRKIKLQFHQQGHIKVLVNCEILTEGYDDWRVSCILLARPTQSESLYTQMIGRGTRIKDGIGNLLEALERGIDVEKKDCLILDAVDNTSRHSLVTLASLFGMNAETNLHGRKITEVVEELEELKAAKPFVDVTNVKDISELKTYVEQVDLFKVPYAPEILQLSEYQWRKSGNDTYVLLLVGGESVVVMRDLLDNWHVTGTVKGNKFLETKKTFEDAIRDGDYLVKLLGGRSIASCAKRNAKWGLEPPTPAQIESCRRMRIVVPPGATKGEVAQKMNYEIGKRREQRLKGVFV